MKQQNQIPKVAVMVETSRGYARDILRGVLRYEVLYGPWELYAVPGGREEQHLPDWTVSGKRGKKGIIAHITTEEMAKEIIAVPLPTVSVFPTDDIPDIAKKIRSYSEVRCDSAAIGRMGAAHLLERHFLYYGFVGELYDADWSRLRRDAFCETITQNGYETFLYPTPSPEESDWTAEQHRLSRWLQTLPKPIGIFAATDIRGRRVIEACHKARIAVPDEAAVLGVDNDELFCETITPRLSSISIDAERAGYESAALLNQLMFGGKERTSAVFGPLRTVSRQSSDFYRVEDKMVAEALKYIQTHYSQPIGVPDIVRATKGSRRILEIRFKKNMGHSIMEEIKKRRLNKVKLLLLDSDLSLEEIAEHCGFQSKNYLINVFRKEFHMTMGAFRESHHHPVRKRLR
ncbi:MAG: DNA-binding transcriptional regulator [Planctomycetaceae bacterium]|jgi:LacI family transcriptional regulator|nr:DNA-binding transcriptional regulator [Planctomycetaceae bacterium]